MEFTFGDAVKLATKGYKPSDVEELRKLDENKFSKDDILSLIASGYSKSEVIKLVDTFTTEDSEGTDETEDQDEPPQDEKKKKPDKHKANEVDSSEDESDDVDYKKKYEEEKKLREELQHKKAASGTAIKTDTKSDIDLAMEIAAEYY